MQNIPKNNEENDYVPGLNLILKKLIGSQSNSVLTQCDEGFQQLIKQFPKRRNLLYQYNEFRIAYLTKLPKRPQILIGGPFCVNFPTVHHYPLFEVADVICLNCSPYPLPTRATIQCSPYSLFYDILKKLPPGFVPDFYWDNQIEQRHYIPQGIEIAPFPIVASVCHTFLQKSIEQVCELFDLVLPVSKSFVKILKKFYPDKIIDLPFGVNWGSFDYFIDPSIKNKKIDLCLTFGESTSPVFPYRSKVIELTKKFKEKYKDRFSIEIVHELPQEEYRDLLSNSRIAINVTGIHGSYNYRTIEAMCSGTLVFQLDWKHDDIDNTFSELFLDGVHGVSFNFDNFEQKLLYYLENRDKTEEIAKNALTFLNDNYSYSKLYRDLTRVVKEHNFVFPRKLAQHAGYHIIDMIYYNQNDFTPGLISYGLLHYAYESNWIKYNNLMVSVHTLLENDEMSKFLTALVSEPFGSSEKADTWTLCCQFHKKSLESIPKEFTWIVEWNFLLLALEAEQATQSDIEHLITQLETAVVSPFDEHKVIFKYYVDGDRYPLYAQRGLNSSEFLNLNLGLMKHIDNPIERARLHYGYALAAAKYFLKAIVD